MDILDVLCMIPDEMSMGLISDVGERINKELKSRRSMREAPSNYGLGRIGSRRDAIKNIYFRR